MQPPHRSKITTPLYFPGPRIPALAVVQRDALKDASKHTVTKRRFRVVNKSSARRGFIGHPMVADSAAASLVSSVHWRNQGVTTSLRRLFAFSGTVSEIAMLRPQRIAACLLGPD